MSGVEEKLGATLATPTLGDETTRGVIPRSVVCDNARTISLEKELIIGVKMLHHIVRTNLCPTQSHKHTRATAILVPKNQRDQ